MADYHTLYATLVPLYGRHEAQGIARMVMREAFGIDLAGIVMGRDRQMSAADEARLAAIVGRLGSGEPVQYVLGVAELCGNSFRVDSRTLIPRPETGQLVGLISEREEVPESILDVGTGTGCIAICLKKRFPQSRVVAIDSSAAALEVAKDNARSNGVEVEFRLQDALRMASDGERFALIVSNPPYICQKEAREMERNVLDYEPHEALFVPDDDPLLFYRAIGEFAAGSLLPRGELWFEINPAYCRELQAILERQGYADVAIIDDSFNKKRFAHAHR